MKKIYTILALALTFFCSAQLSQVLPYTSTNGFGATQTDDTMIYNNEFYGSTAGTVSSVELRKFNGTTITEIKSFPGYYSGSLASTMMLGSFNKTESKLYFITTQTLYNTNYTVNESTSELWVTDGSAAGTLKLLTVTRPGNFAFNIILTNTHYGAFKTNSNYVGDKLIFSTYNTTMVTDGTVAGTKPLTANGAPIPMLSMPGPKLNGKYYFSATDGTLHSTDGTDEGTQNIVSNSIVSVYSPMSMPLNGKFMFWGNNSESGTELWESDGTAAGTKLFYETVPGTETGKIIYGNSIDMANDGKHIYFMLANGTDREVWSTDLTVANTKKIKDANNYLPQLSVLGNGIIYFQENTISPPYLSKIWKSDGTPEGTKQISDVFKSNSMALYQNSLYFQRAENKTTIGSNQVDNNIELWKSDGEPENTRMIFDIYPGGLTSPYVVANKSEPGMFFVLNDVLYFVAKNASGKFIYKFKGDYTFNGVTNNNWSNPNNWNSGVAPGIQDLVNIPAGFNLNIDTNSFGKDVNVSSPLNLSSGNLNIGGYLNLGANITLNNNNLNLKGGNSNISRSTLASGHYIVTNGTGTVNVENLDAARGTVNLPIGTANNYNPISISNSGTSDTFSARVSDGIQNTTNGAVNSTWEISEATAGGSNVNLTLGWNASQENSSFSRNSAKVGHYLNGSWNEENSGTVSGTDPFTISATGITSFSPFSVMNFGALGTHDFSKSKVSVYPNPFNENLNISTENGGVVYFYDLSGKLVSTSVLMKGTNSLNKSSLAKGVYIYQIKNTNGEVVSSGKIIKK